jgi:thioredoxin-like negative regulator of GroEL
MKGTLVLDCYADWCGPCRKLSPLLEAEVNKNDNVRLAKLNVDVMERFPQMLDISAIPAVFAFYKGDMIATFVGCPAPHDLTTWVTNVNNPDPVLQKAKEGKD